MGVRAPRLCTRLLLAPRSAAPRQGQSGPCSACFCCLSWESLSERREGSYTGLQPSANCQGSMCNEVGCFGIFPEELCTAPLSPSKNRNTKIELSTFQNIYNFLIGINEKVVSLENIRTVFSLNKQIVFAVLILLITL